MSKFTLLVVFFQKSGFYVPYNFLLLRFFEKWFTPLNSSSGDLFDPYLHYIQLLCYSELRLRQKRYFY